MAEKKDAAPSPQDAYSQWMKIGTAFWEPMVKTWTEAATALWNPKNRSAVSQGKDRWQYSIEASMNTYSAILSAMGQNDSS